MARRCFILVVFSGLFSIVPVFSYTVVLKNGKTVEGTWISENNEVLVLQDSSGIKIHFKKANIDLEKTALRNKKEEPVSATPAAPATSATQAARPSAPKKPARRYTQEDLIKLREKHDLGTGTFGEGAEEEEAGEDTSPTEEKKEPAGEKSEEYWRNAAREHSAALQQAQKIYHELKQDCDSIMGLVANIDTVTNSRGERLSVWETREKICAQMEAAQKALERAKEEYNAFLTEAKQEGVPPGWIRNEDGSDPEEQPQ